MRKRMLAVILALFLVLGMLPGTALAADVSFASGSLNEDFTWYVDYTSGQLTITGKGDMPEYKELDGDYYHYFPWNSFWSYIQSIRFVGPITSISRDAFFGLKNLTSIEIPLTVTKIGVGAFASCENLKSITIPSSVVEIDGGAFYETGLKTVYIPSSVEKGITSTSFRHCTQLEAIYVDSHNPAYSSLDGVLYNKDQTTLITFPAGKKASTFVIPASVNRIEGIAFELSHVENVIIPNGVKSILVGTFAECGELISLTLPSSLKNVSSNTFYGSSLTDVYYEGSKEAWEKVVVEEKNNEPFLNATFHYNTTTSTPTVVTSEYAEKFVQTALDQVGKTASAFPFSGAWCDQFVGWCARQVMVAENQNLQSVIPYSGGSCGTLFQNVADTGGYSIYFSDVTAYNSEYFSTNKVLASGIKINREDYEPQVGDLVFFRPTLNTGTVTFSHVGIVCDVDDTYTYVVHGNWHSRVCAPDKCLYSECGKFPRNGTKSQGVVIVGYSRPNWNALSSYTGGTTDGVVNCPVEVTISYKGEILDSAAGQLTASFGTMSVGSADEGISFHLNGYYDVETTIVGTGTGTMNFSVTHTDADGTASKRTFVNVPITEDTVIKVVDPNHTAAGVSLLVYRDDGETFEETWYSDSNTPVTSADSEATDWRINGDADGGIMDEPDLPDEPEIPDTPDTPDEPEVPDTPDKPDTPTYPTYPSTPSKPSTPPSTSTTPSTPTTTPPTTTTPAEPEQPSRPVETPVETPTETPVEEPLPFTDAARDAYYYDAVRWAVAQGITTGTTATLFSPDESCTRAQVVTFLWRAAGSPVPQGGGNPFTDLQPGAYYTDAVQWAVEQGVTSGTTETTFGPDETVTRSQAVTFLYRTAGSPAVTGGSSFADVDGGAYYADAVRWAVAQGVTTGTGADAFSPDDPCTRAQIVTFLYRAK